MVYPFEGEITDGELNGRIGLQRHVCLQTVVIHTGNHGFLTIVGCLLIDDTCQGDNFRRCQLQLTGFSRSFFIPEGIILFLHPFQEIVQRDIPIDIVCVGNEEGRNRQRVKS